MGEGGQPALAAGGAAGDPSGGMKRSAEDAFTEAAGYGSPRLRSNKWRSRLLKGPFRVLVRRAGDEAKQARVEVDPAPPAAAADGGAGGGPAAESAAAAEAPAAAAAAAEPTAPDLGAAPSAGVEAPAATAASDGGEMDTGGAEAGGEASGSAQESAPVEDMASSASDNVAPEAASHSESAPAAAPSAERPGAGAAEDEAAAGTADMDVDTAAASLAAASESAPAEAAGASEAAAAPVEAGAGAPAAEAAASAPVKTEPEAAAAAPAQTEAASEVKTEPGTTGEATKDSTPPLEKDAAQAMLREVDGLLKKELAFLRQTEGKFGARAAANGDKPAGARKRRSTANGSQVAPLSMAGLGAGALDDRFRSPRTPKPNSRWTQKAGPTGISAVLKPFEKVLERMMKHRDAATFVLPVDQLWPIESLPGYFDVIKKPMDLGTVKTRLAEGYYGDNPDSMASDVRLVFSNCMTYNGPDSEFHQAAARMNALFEQAFKDTSEQETSRVEKERLTKQRSTGGGAKKSRPKSSAQPRASRPSKPKEKEKKKKSKKDKNRGVSANEIEHIMRQNLQRMMSGNTEPAEEKVPKRTMELWEKERLVKMMDKLQPDKFGTALSIIKQSHRVDMEEMDSDEEVTIDIDTLDSRTLWKLHKYVEDNIPKKRPSKKKVSQAEKQRQDRHKLAEREAQLRAELSQLSGASRAAAALSSSSDSSSSDSDSD